MARGVGPRGVGRGRKRSRVPRWRAFVEALPQDLARHVLRFLSRPPHLAAVVTAGRAILLEFGSERLRALGGRAAGGVVTDAQFFPTGGRLVTADSSGMASVWSASGSRVLVLVQGHSEGSMIFQVRVFHDGSRVVTIGADAAAVIWDATSGEMLQRLRRPRAAHREVRVCPSGRRIATAVSHIFGDDAVVWELAEAVARPLQWRLDTIRFLEMSPCGRKLVTGGEGTTLRVWSFETGALQRQLSSITGWTSAVAITAGGAMAVASTIEGGLRVWDIGSGETAWATRLPGGTQRFAMLPDGERLVAFSSAAAWVLDIRTGAHIRNLTLVAATASISAAPDSGLVALCLARRHRRLAIWDTAGGRPLRWFALPPPTEGAVSPCFVSLGPSGTMADLLAK